MAGRLFYKYLLLAFGWMHLTYMHSKVRHGNRMHQGYEDAYLFSRYEMKKRTASSNGEILFLIVWKTTSASMSKYP